MKIEKIIIILFTFTAFNSFADGPVETYISIRNGIVQPDNISLAETWVEDIIKEADLIIINYTHNFGSIENIGMEGYLNYNGRRIFELNPSKILECAFDADVYLNQIVNPGSSVTIPLEKIVGMNFSSSCRLNPIGTIMEEIDKLKVANNNYIPSGIYHLCFRLYDISTAQFFNTDCGTIEVLKFQPPLLIQPYNGEVISIEDRPNFRWTSVFPAPLQNDAIFYKMMLVELLDGQSAINALRYNFTLFESDYINNTEFLWPEHATFPEVGKTYVWGVRAVTRSNSSPNGYISATIDNEGYSEPYIFTVKSGEPVLIFPDDNSLVKDNTVNFLWNMDNPYGYISLSRLLVYTTSQQQDGYTAYPLPVNTVFEQVIRDNNETTISWSNIEEIYFGKELFWTIEYFDRLENRIKYVRANKFTLDNVISKKPVLISPEGEIDDALVHFQWSKSPYAMQTNIETSYKLFAVEILKGQKVEDAIASNQYVASIENIKSTSFQYYSDKVFPVVGARYAWSVIEIITSTGEENEAAKPMRFEFKKASSDKANALEYSLNDCYSKKRASIQDIEEVDMSAANLIKDTLKIGGFDMIISEIKGNYKNAAGRGYIHIPLLDRTIETVFDSIKINKFKEVIGGYAIADIKDGVPFYFENSSTKTENPDTLKLKLNSIHNSMNKINNQTDYERVPFYFNDKNTISQYQQANNIIVSSIKFNPAPDKSTMNVFSILNMSQLQHQIYYTGEIPFTKEGVLAADFEEFSKISLKLYNSDYASESLNLKFSGNNRMFFNCKGLYKLNLDFKVDVPVNKLINNYYDNDIVSINFNDEVSDWSNWIIKSKSTELVKAGNEKIPLNVLDFYFDNSDLLNVRNANYPAISYQPVVSAKGLVPVVVEDKDLMAKIEIDSIIKDVHPILFPIGSKSFSTDISWVIRNFDVKYSAQNKSVILNWQVNNKEISNYRVIIFKSYGNNGLKQVGELIETSESDYQWSDIFISSEISNYRYAIRIITNDGEMQTSDVLQIEIK